MENKNKDKSLSDFWMNADKTTVQNYLKQNIEDMDKYEQKREDIMKRVFEAAQQNNGVITTRFFLLTMLVMLAFGLISALLLL